MADIVDPVVLKFMNEEVRPLCAILQALEARLEAVQARALNQVAPAVQGNAPGDLVEDGRAPQGIAQYLKSDLVKFNGTISSLLTVLRAANVADVLDKGAINPVRVRVDFDE